MCDPSGLASGFFLEPVAGLADLLHPVAFLKDCVGQRTEGESPHGMCFHNLIRQGDGDGNPIDGRNQGVPLYLGIPNSRIHLLILILEITVLTGRLREHFVTFGQLLVSGFVDEVRPAQADEGHLQQGVLDE